MPLRPDTLEGVKRRLSDTRESRQRTRAAVVSGKWLEAEDDPTRGQGYSARVAMVSGIAEAVHGTNDFLPAAFLARGAVLRRAVARVVVQLPTETTTGSGFLISPDLFITNQHVIRDKNDAANAVAIFDDELDSNGVPLRKSTYRFVPDRVALFSDENDLDYAVLAIGERVDGAAPIEELGYCPLTYTPDRHRKGMNVNIIQHPNGMPKIVVVRNNLLTDQTDTRLLYETDTDTGSSGSPVYNDQWDVVALHHFGAPSDAHDQAAAANENEGIRISAIYRDLEARIAKEDVVTQEFVRRALSLWSDTSVPGKRLERRPPAAVQPEHTVVVDQPKSKDEAMNQTTPSGQSIVIPLELNIRFGSTALSAGTIPPQSGDAGQNTVFTQNKRLSHAPSAAEASKVDTDFTNRNGFDKDFIAGVQLDLTSIAKPKKPIVAPLVSGGNKSLGELRYQNFSVVMHKDRKFALVTATNIDGPTYVSIDRKTGKPSAVQPEGETWYSDSRIDDAYIVGQTFYSGWSHLFDRGHLTRRDDPTWGEFATRANSDTFHFTNCTPQHWKFNQSIKYWQGIERYVLEQGLFVTGRRKQLSVLQGPVFDDENDLWADDIQVPSAFWKIVVWNGSGGVKAVALIADQTSLFSLQRGGGAAPPPADTPVDITEYRSSIATIESKTGLDLKAIRPFDVSADLPTVGEALSVVTKWEDIRLA